MKRTPKFNYVALNEYVKQNKTELILDDTLELVDEAEFNYRNSQLPDGDSCQHQVLAYVSGKTTFAQLCDIVGHHDEGYKYARDIVKQYFGMV